MVVRFNVLRQVVLPIVSALVAQAAVAQDSPANGKVVYETNAIQPCTACHGEVQNRRDVIDPGGDVDFDDALARFQNAITTVGVMNKFGPLPQQQRRNIAAYIADVPKARPTPVNYNASAVSVETAAQTLTFANAVTSGTTGGGSAAPLTINSVGLAGTNPTHFVLKAVGTTCANSMVLAAGSSCTVGVSFLTGTSSAKTALLSVNYTQGGVTTTRTAQLNGTVAGAPPPPSSADGGGGAFSSLGLGLLLLASGLRRRR